MLGREFHERFDGRVAQFGGAAHGYFVFPEQFQGEKLGGLLRQVTGVELADHLKQICR